VGFTSSASRTAFLGNTQAKAAATRAFANVSGINESDISATYTAASRRLEQARLRSLQSSSFGVLAQYTIQNVNPTGAQSIKSRVARISGASFTEALSTAMTNAGLPQFASASVTGVTATIIGAPTTTSTTPKVVRKTGNGSVGSTISLATFFVAAFVLALSGCEQ